MTATLPALTSPPWAAQAACSYYSDDTFYPEGSTNVRRAQTRLAKAICGACPVTAACLTFALNNHETGGIWGGLDPDERKQLADEARLAKRRAQYKADAA